MAYEFALKFSGMRQEVFIMNRLLMIVFWMVMTLTSLPSVLAQQNDWPRTLTLEQGMVTIYSLQVDEVSKNTIHFRAALAYRATADSEPVFGAGWFESPVEIDSSNRIVHPTDLVITETRFPAGTADVQSELAAALAQQSAAWNLDFSLDELETALMTAEAESRTGENLNTAPPRIIYRDHPALLISMDGEPVLREIENSPLEAVINTPYPLIFDRKHYYLNAARDVWYRADRATGPYRFDSNPPADIVAMVKANDADETNKQLTESVTAANAPEIIVTTEPAELIVTEGPAAFVPLVDDLLVLQNSDDDVFMHVSSQNYYIVLAGRWYRASSLGGPWAYQLADKLPTAFTNIPRDSNQADSRVYVAGTEEARDAVLDAQVPQTAAVTRGEVDIEVIYDGEPIYAPVDGTGLVYIENTGSTVIQSDGLYYLVEDGVWYVSATPDGPWQVSDHRPQQVDTILPTSPLYNVKYVRVYDSTPSVVYVGYTPGYTGSYVYRNTIFYGTGWHYRPWVSPYYYYPRHSTWGYHAGYNPWSGWNYGLSWGWGPFSVSYYPGGYWHHNHYWHNRHQGHWGPRGYRHRSVHNNYGQKRYSQNRFRRSNYGRNDHRRNDYRRNDHDGNAYDGRRSNSYDRHDNLYRDRSQRARIVNTRDNRPRTPGNRKSDTRQANYTGASNTRQKNYTGLKKGERNRIGPVNSSDLRSKADVRDANFRADRSRLLADNNGNVYRKTSRNSDMYAPVSRSGPSAKSTKKRIVQSPSRNGRNVKSAKQNGTQTPDWLSNKRGEKRIAKSVDIASSQTSRSRTAENRTRQRSSTAVNTPTRQSQTKKRDSTRQRISPAINAPVQQSQARTSKNTGRQSSPAVNARPRQSQARTRDNTRQRSSPVVNAPVRQSQQKTRSNTRQQAPRVVSAPMQKQSRSRSNAPPRGSSSGARKNSAPAKSSTQKSARNNSKQRKGSKSNSADSKRTGGSRSRDR